MSTIAASYAPATWSRYPVLLSGARYRAYFAPAFRAGVIDRAYHMVPLLAQPPTGVFMSYVIGKLSHDSKAHPGTRVESRHGSSVWHCPCGYQTGLARQLHRHVERAKDSSSGQRCPLTVAAELAAATANIRAALKTMSMDELQAYIARLST